MAIQHYKGELGEFDYDDIQFTVVQSGFPTYGPYGRVYYPVNDVSEKGRGMYKVAQLENDFGYSMSEHLYYIGSETDGSKIEIPEGLVNGFGLFAGCPVTSCPRLPKSLRNISAMFYCSDVSSLPDQDLSEMDIEAASYAFGGCDLTGDQSLCTNFVSNFMFGNVKFNDCSSFRIYCLHKDKPLTVEDLAFDSTEFIGSDDRLFTIEAAGDLSLGSIVMPVNCSSHKISADHLSLFEDRGYQTSISNRAGIESLDVSLNSLDIDRFSQTMRFYQCDQLRSFNYECGGVKYTDTDAFNAFCFPRDRAYAPVIDVRQYADCHSFKGPFPIPENVRVIMYGAFVDCKNMTDLSLPDSLSEIGDHAFSGCESLSGVVKLPDDIRDVGFHAFNRCPKLDAVLYKGVDILPFLNRSAYGYSPFEALKMIVDTKLPLNNDSFEGMVHCLHGGSDVSSFVRDFRLYGNLQISEYLKIDPSEEELSDVKKAFKDRVDKFHGHVPKCVDDLALTARLLSVSPGFLADHFDVPFVKKIRSEGIPFIPAMACRCYYDKSVCESLCDKGLLSVMTDAVMHYNTSRHNPCYKHAMDFIATHMNTDIDVLRDIVANAEYYNLSDNFTMDDYKREKNRNEGLREISRIEKYYKDFDLKLSECRCDIPSFSSEYGDRVSRILNFNDSSDLCLASMLGDITSCCQHLGGAGSTAMMHGFLNPDAGFFVIEDKNGQVKAQAEIWLADQDTLVFDNIEFAHIPNEKYEAMIDSLRGDIAHFAANVPYKNIVLGTGWNDFKTDLCEKSEAPVLRLTPYEAYILQNECDKYVHFDSVSDALDYIKNNKDYDPDDFVYSDAGNSVYIKKDGIVGDYFSSGYKESKAGDAFIMDDSVSSENEFINRDPMWDIVLDTPSHPKKDKSDDVVLFF